MNYWLVKSEPDAYSWSDLVKDGRTAWTGVRNFAARNHLRAMANGDPVIFYHSGEGTEIVVKTAYPDPTAKEGDWSCVDLAPVKPVKTPVTLAAMKADTALKDLKLLRQGRLSVSPVSGKEFARLMELAGL